MLRSLFLFVGALILPAVGVAAEAATTPSMRIQRQLDGLLKQRLRPEPLPLDLPSPFVFPGTATREGGFTSAAMQTPLKVETASAGGTAALANREAVADNNADVLAVCAGRLHFGGAIRIKDQLQVVINQLARKEGDFIAVPWNGSPVYIRIVRLLPGQITLRLSDAEMTLNYSSAGSAEVSR
jgi:hypothetical protein